MPDVAERGVGFRGIGIDLQRLDRLGGGARRYSRGDPLPTITVPNRLKQSASAACAGA